VKPAFYRLESLVLVSIRFIVVELLATGWQTASMMPRDGAIIFGDLESKPAREV